MCTYKMEGLIEIVIVTGNGHNELSSNPRHGYTFHFVRAALEKIHIYLFSLQLWINNRADWVLYLSYKNWFWRKTLNLKSEFCSCIVAQTMWLPVSQKYKNVVFLKDVAIERSWLVVRLTSDVTPTAWDL